jgi:hypothetical protein
MFGIKDQRLKTTGFRAGEEWDTGFLMQDKNKM